MKPVSRILLVALLAGGLSFAAGFFGPIFLTPGNNLGPLFGIFITGPIGFLAGAVLGAFWSVIRTEGQVAYSELTAFLVIFFFSFLGCYWWANSSWSAYVMAVGLALFTIAVGILILGIKKLRRKIPTDICIAWAIALGAASLMVLMAVFPPSTIPWWVPVNRLPPEIAQGVTPPFVYIMDSRLDASTSYPHLAVNKSLLAFQWIIVAVAAFGFTLVSQFLRKKKRGEK